jgi:hypothetical protein
MPRTTNALLAEEVTVASMVAVSWWAVAAVAGAIVLAILFIVPLFAGRRPRRG